MLPQTFNPALYHWLIRPRKIEWCITMGFNARRKPNIIGTLVTSLAYIDDQGDKWGDTYVKIVGQHYEDYAHWSSYKKLLDAKLEEELQEYLASDTVEELADLVEVVYAILKYKEIDIDTFENIIAKKAAERGAFDKRILLKEVLNK